MKVLLPFLEPQTLRICILKLPDKEIYPNEGEIEKKSEEVTQLQRISQTDKQLKSASSHSELKETNFKILRRCHSLLS